MTDEQLATVTGDFDDFLRKIVMNYDINYPALAGVIMARMVTLAQISQSENALLLLFHQQQHQQENPI